MSIYDTRAALGADWGPHQCQLLGLRHGDVGYGYALELAARGKCAWQIAEAMQCSPDVAARLGAPGRA